MQTSSVITALKTPVDIDATELDHEAWNNAESVALTRYWSGAEAPPSRHAEARLVWSPQSLGVRFVCRQDEPLVISANPQTETKTMGLWDRDVCEIFIAPDPDAPTHYYEFEAAPTREWIDLELQTTPGGRETNWEFRSGMTTAARIDGNRIVVAMRIPWSRAIGKPAIGDQWRINLCRCIGKDPDRGYVAWQPTRTEEPNFHVPRVFGSLLFAA